MSKADMWARIDLNEFLSYFFDLEGRAVGFVQRVQIKDQLPVKSMSETDILKTKF